MHYINWRLIYKFTCLFTNDWCWCRCGRWRHSEADEEAAMWTPRFE